MYYPSGHWISPPSSTRWPTIGELFGQRVPITRTRTYFQFRVGGWIWTQFRKRDANSTGTDKWYRWRGEVPCIQVLLLVLELVLRSRAAMVLKSGVRTAENFSLEQLLHTRFTCCDSCSRFACALCFFFATPLAQLWLHVSFVKCSCLSR